MVLPYGISKPNCADVFTQSVDFHLGAAVTQIYLLEEKGK